MGTDSDRTKDSIEQLDDRRLPNPITEAAATLGEAGDAMRPDGEHESGEDKDADVGPAPHITQMPR
jgi:hypothetical protein